MTGLHDLFQHGHDVGEVVAQTLVGQQDVGLGELAFQTRRVVGHVRGDEAVIEHHALEDLHLDAEVLRLLDRDDAVTADGIHSLRDLLADLAVARRNRRDLGDLLTRGNLDGVLENLVGHHVGGALDAAAQRQRIGTGDDATHSLAHDSVGKDGRRRGAVARVVVRGDSGLAHDLHAHVLDGIFKIDIGGHRGAVVGNVGLLVLLLHGDVAPLRADRHPHGIGQLVDAGSHLRTGFVVERNVFGHSLVPFSSVCGASPSPRAR